MDGQSYISKGTGINIFLRRIIDTNTIPESMRKACLLIFLLQIKNGFNFLDQISLPTTGGKYVFRLSHIDISFNILILLYLYIDMQPSNE